MQSSAWKVGRNRPTGASRLSCITIVRRNRVCHEAFFLD